MALSRTIPTRRLCTQAEAAEFLGVTTRTVRKYIASGRLTAYRVGARMVRLDADEVEALPVTIPSAGGAA